MKNWSGHIYFDNDFEWKNLEKPFPDIWEIITKETKQNQEEAQYDTLYLELNKEEMRRNKKPFGYTKEGAKFRMVFPLNAKEMIIYRGMMSEDIKDVTEKIAKILKAKKVKISVEYDKMFLYDVKRRKK